MKIRISNREHGIVLVATLATVLIIAVILTSYLSLVNNQNTSVARSQQWNEAIPVLESGIEEALTQLQYEGTNSINLTSNNWTYGTDGLYHKSRALADGSYYNVSIQVAANPVITSTGYVAWAYSSTSSNTQYLTRRVKVLTKKQPPAPGGLNAKGAISFSGAKTYLDSFDSSNPLYSSNGQYVASLRESNGGATTDSTNAGAINTGSGEIFGSATTGPGGTVSGTVTGTIANNANLQFNDISMPAAASSGATAYSGTLSSTNYTYLLTGAVNGTQSYTMSGGLNMSGGALAVNNGNVTLYVEGPLSISGGGYIYIAPGASLTMYLDGSASMAGGGIINGAATASQCTIYGTTNCTSIQYSGGAAFTGTIDAPDADIGFKGSTDITGAVTGSTITITGNSAFHYDEALAHNGQNYVAISWNEF